jgi:hypothetical protein
MFIEEALIGESRGFCTPAGALAESAAVDHSNEARSTSDRSARKCGASREYGKTRIP